MPLTTIRSRTLLLLPGGAVTKLWTLKTFALESLLSATCGLQVGIKVTTSLESLSLPSINSKASTALLH